MEQLVKLRKHLNLGDSEMIKKEWNNILNSVETKDFDVDFLVSNLKSIDLELKSDEEVIDIVKIHISSLNTLLQLTST